jgi:membrane-associated phospholipid phosphatase
VRFRIALLLLIAFPASAGEIKNALRDARSLAAAPFHWKQNEWTRFAEGTALVVAVAAFDKPIMDFVQRNRSGFSDNVSEVVTPLGGGRGPEIAALMFASGALFHNQKLEGAGRDALISELWSAGVVTQVIKRVAGRARPFVNEGTHSFQPEKSGEKEYQSFPSGHATNAFALATAIAGHYTSTPAKILVYTLATSVAYSRVNDNVHWPSDVVAGALIGRAVAKGVTFRHTHVTLSFEFNPATRSASRDGSSASLPASLRGPIGHSSFVEPPGAHRNLSGAR